MASVASSGLATLDVPAVSAMVIGGASSSGAGSWSSNTKVALAGDTSLVSTSVLASIVGATVSIRLLVWNVELV